MDSEHIKQIGGRLVKYFLRGILITLPVTATIWLIIWLIRQLDSIIPIDKPGYSIIIILVGLTLIGFLGSGLLIRPILDLFDDLLERVPGVKVIYGTIKDFLEAFVGDKRKFSEPVIAEIGHGLYKMGFVTHKDLSAIELEGYVAVYFPHSYNFSGNVFLVPKEKIKPIKGNPSEIMKFIVTGGVTDISEAVEKKADKISQDG